MFSCLFSLLSPYCLTCVCYFSVKAVAKCLLKSPNHLLKKSQWSYLFTSIQASRRLSCLISYNLQLARVRRLAVIWPDGRALPRRLLWKANHIWVKFPRTRKMGKMCHIFFIFWSCSVTKRSYSNIVHLLHHTRSIQNSQTNIYALRRLLLVSQDNSRQQGQDRAKWRRVGSLSTSLVFWGRVSFYYCVQYASFHTRRVVNKS